MKDADIINESQRQARTSEQASKEKVRKPDPSADLRIDKRKLVIYSEIMKPKFD